MMLDCLKTLTDKGFLEYRYSTLGGNGFYQITDKGNSFFQRRIKYGYDKNVARQNSRSEQYVQ